MVQGSALVLMERRRGGEGVEREEVENRKTGIQDLSHEVLLNIADRLPFPQNFRAKCLLITTKSWASILSSDDCIGGREHDDREELVSTQTSFAPLMITEDFMSTCFVGYDNTAGTWRLILSPHKNSLMSLLMRDTLRLSAPFKYFNEAMAVSGSMFMWVGRRRSPNSELIIIYNLLTGRFKFLPAPYDRGNIYVLKNGCIFHATRTGFLIVLVCEVRTSHKDVRILVYHSDRPRWDTFHRKDLKHPPFVFPKLIEGSRLYLFLVPRNLRNDRRCMDNRWPWIEEENNKRPVLVRYNIFTEEWRETPLPNHVHLPELPEIHHEFNPLVVCGNRVFIVWARYAHVHDEFLDYFGENGYDFKIFEFIEASETFEIVQCDCPDQLRDSSVVISSDEEHIFLHKGNTYIERVYSYNVADARWTVIFSPGAEIQVVHNCLTPSINPFFDPSTLPETSMVSGQTDPEVQTSTLRDKSSDRHTGDVSVRRPGLRSLFLRCCSGH